MTRSKKRALAGLIICGTVLVSFTLIFFSRGGAATYIDDTFRKAASASLFGAGYIIYFVMILRTRRTPCDERDDAVSTKAGLSALTIVLLYIYILSISLYEIYRSAGSLPVSWMWFIGYSNSFVGPAAHSITTLFLYRGAGNDG